MGGLGLDCIKGILYTFYTGKARFFARKKEIVSISDEWGRMIMSYTMSFDASKKVRAADVSGYLIHAARELDETPRRHSNPNIDTARSADNVTLVYDARSGEYRRCTDRRQIRAALEERLGHVEKPLRKDAVVMRGLILQMDPAWYRDNADEQRRDGPAMAALSWAEKTFGRKNLVMAALHKDEDGDHLHLGFCPVTEDGRLSQKDWFKGPAELRQMHDDLREYMRGEGYDVELHRKKGSKHAKRLTEAEYRGQKEHEAELEQRAKAVAEREAEVEARARVVEREAAEAAQKLQEARELAGEVQGALEGLSAAEAAYRAAGANVAGDMADWMRQKMLRNKNGNFISAMDVFQQEHERDARQKATRGREAAARAARPRRMIDTSGIMAATDKDPSLSR